MIKVSDDDPTDRLTSTSSMHFKDAYGDVHVDFESTARTEGVYQMIDQGISIEVRDTGLADDESRVIEAFELWQQRAIHDLRQAITEQMEGRG